MEDARTRRVQRELKTVGAMIVIYCRAHHGSKDELCADCEKLWAYAEQRVTHCPQLPDKPACAKCARHCYASLMREHIRAVMRYSGPRMLWRHPVLAFLHFADSKL